MLIYSISIPAIIIWIIIGYKTYHQGDNEMFGCSIGMIGISLWPFIGIMTLIIGIWMLINYYL